MRPRIALDFAEVKQARTQRGRVRERIHEQRPQQSPEPFMHRDVETDFLFG